MYQVLPLFQSAIDPEILASFSLMTHPNLRLTLFSPSKNGEVIALGALFFGEPIGLLVAVIEKTKSQSRIASLYVKPAYRRHGVASMLLDKFEGLLKKKNISSIRYIYAAGEGSTPVQIDGLLHKHHWPAPKPSLLVTNGKFPDVIPPRLNKKYSLEDTVSIVPWSDITKEEREKIRQQEGTPLWQNKLLSPFYFEQQIEPKCSYGVRKDGEVIGWLICHRMSPSVLRYSSLFIRKDLSKKGFGLLLLQKSLVSQLKRAIPIGMFQADPKNRILWRFVNHTLSNYLYDNATLMTTKKQVAQ